MQCTTTTCTREATRKGLCPACYQREYRKAHPSTSNGTPTLADAPAIPFMDASPVSVQTIPSPAPSVDCAGIPIPTPTVTTSDDDPTDDTDDAGRLIAEALRQVSTRSRGVSPEVQRCFASLDERLDVVTDAVEQQGTTLDGLSSRLADLERREPPPPPHINITVSGTTRTVDGLQHKIFPRVLRYVAHGKHVYLYGPAGSGKTTMAGQVAQALGRPFFHTGALYTKYDIIGSETATGYKPSDFRRAYEAGGIFLFDEMDSSDSRALVAFNAALENGSCAFPDAIVPRHHDFVAIGAANTIGRGADRVYVGREPLDGATLDRFAQIAMDYDYDLEMSIVGTDDIGKAWTLKVQTWRDRCYDLKIRHIISPRASIWGAIMLRDGAPESEIMADLVFRGLDPAQVQKIMGA